MTLVLILLILALITLVAAAVNVRSDSVNLTALGLAFFVAAALADII